MEPRGRLRPEVTQLWCWGPDGATTTEERLSIDDAAAVRDALRKEAGGDRAPYPAWVSTAWHVLRWDEPSARVSWELVSLALHQTASVDAPLPCAALAAFVGTRAALAASRAPAVVEDEARIQTRAATEDEAPHAKRERRAAAKLELGDPESAVRELEGILARDPGEERARALLVRARLAVRAQRAGSGLD